MVLKWDLKLSQLWNDQRSYLILLVNLKVSVKTTSLLLYERLLIEGLKELCVKHEITVRDGSEGNFSSCFWLPDCSPETTYSLWYLRAPRKSPSANSLKNAFIREPSKKTHLLLSPLFVCLHFPPPLTCTEIAHNFWLRSKHRNHKCGEQKPMWYCIRVKGLGVLSRVQLQRTMLVRENSVGSQEGMTRCSHNKSLCSVWIRPNN